MTTAAPPATAPATDEARLYASVLAAPKDDAPRLILADWLDEHAGDVPCPTCGEWGDDTHARNIAAGIHVGCTGRVPNGNADRAEFIRVQCELATILRVKGLPPDARELPDGVIRLRDREQDQLTNNAMKWLPDLPGMNRVIAGWTQHTRRDDGENIMIGPELVIRAEWRRGFVDSVHLTLAAFLPPCGKCRGDGTIGVEDDLPGLAEQDCPDCSGSGHAAGLASHLGRLPLRADGVTLVDREAYRSEGRFGWWNQSCRDVRPDDELSVHSLPKPLWEELSEWISYAGRPSVLKWYPTRELADRALATACVALARKRAKLTKDGS